ncbi:MAG: 1-(5-phosphoribosyl)-5-[(5-phosphoribosylamino)methylideneamino]imidazole-4-carboxamide isomerase [Duodenibacillus sp.]|nr:1-(5-phosphoribosyl)-5-[(5-phosphoribosylamino)methylideneamino]imidazole-4-carboxamide isomerase [Duodenibacillus sp.]
MLLIPAIDLKGGRCVRLRQGDLERNITVYNDDAVDQAAQWARLGASRIHIVDLDGAKTGAPVNAELIARMVERIGGAAEVEIGGGVRTLTQIEAYVRAGARYVVVGTAAVQNPAFLAEACKAYPGRVIVALDAKDGVVASHGWVASTGVRAVDMAVEFEDLGVAAFLYTDIARDGMLTGVNAEATAELARAVNVPVIASGGMHTLEDVRALLAVEADGVMGAVLGRSLYEGTIDFAAAQRLAAAGAKEA